MTTTTPRLPFFVYGTLMQGCGNDYRIRNRTVSVQPAVLPGHVMYATAYPYVVPASAGQKAAELDPVRGELVTVKPDSYKDVLRSLDGLESYREGDPGRSLYLRTEVTVCVPDPAAGAFCRAWVYLGGLIVRSRDSELVPSGDWRQFQTVLRARREAAARVRTLTEQVMDRVDAEQALTWLLAQPEGCFTEAGYLRDGTVYAA